MVDQHPVGLDVVLEEALVGAAQRLAEEVGADLLGVAE